MQFRNNFLSAMERRHPCRTKPTFIYTNNAQWRGFITLGLNIYEELTGKGLHGLLRLPVTGGRSGLKIIYLSVERVYRLFSVYFPSILLNMLTKVHNARFPVPFRVFLTFILRFFVSLDLFYT